MPTLNEVIEAIAVGAPALAGLVLVLRKLFNDYVQDLRKDVVRERTAKEKLQKALDETASQVEQLIGKLRQIQGQIAEEACRDAEVSHEQLAKLQDLIRALEEGRLKNGEAIAAFRREISQLREIIQQRDLRELYLIAENADLADCLAELGYPTDRQSGQFTEKDLAEIKGRLSNGYASSKRRERNGSGGLAVDPTGYFSGSASQTLLSASQ